MQVSEPALYMLQRESHVLANQMKDYLSIRFDTGPLPDILSVKVTNVTRCLDLAIRI